MGITSTRKVEELTALLERRGAEVESAPAMAIDPVPDDAALRAATRSCIDVPPDLFVATTGLGLRRWFEAAASWGMLDDLLAALAGAEVIARGPKSVGALRAHGLRERWSPPSECFDDVLAYLRGSTLTGRRIVVQEHGRSLSVAANALRRQGASVETVTVYRCAPTTTRPRCSGWSTWSRTGGSTRSRSPAPRPSDILLDVAAASGAAGRSSRRSATACSPPASARSPRRRSSCTASRCSSPAAPASPRWSAPSRSSCPADAAGPGSTCVATGCCSTATASASTGRRSRCRRRRWRCCGRWPSAPATSCRAASLLGHLPSGHAGSEHAVEVAVGRLRAAVGPRLVQTVVKRGYRLPVT